MALPQDTTYYGPGIRQVIAERVIWARRQAGLGSRPVAQKMQTLLEQGWNHNMILGIEKAERDVTYRELRALAEVLGQDYRWLAGENDSEPVVRFGSNRAMPGYLRLIAA